MLSGQEASAMQSLVYLTQISFDIHTTETLAPKTSKTVDNIPQHSYTSKEQVYGLAMGWNRCILAVSMDVFVLITAFKIQAVPLSVGIA